MIKRMGFKLSVGSWPKALIFFKIPEQPTSIISLLIIPSLFSNPLDLSQRSSVISYKVVTWHFCGFLVLAILVLSLAGVFAKLRSVYTGNCQSVSISTLVNQKHRFVDRSAIFEPSHLSMGGWVNDTNDFGLIAFPGMDESFLLFNFWLVCN